METYLLKNQSFSALGKMLYELFTLYLKCAILGRISLGSVGLKSAFFQGRGMRDQKGLIFHAQQKECQSKETTHKKTLADLNLKLSEANKKMLSGFDYVLFVGFAKL